MKITVFTSNQPRHLSLINGLSKIADKVYAIMECNTVFPGEVKDFYNNSDIMRTYFEKVRNAEKAVFNDICFINNNVATLSIKSGDLNRLSKKTLEKALSSDVYIVFGASYIKGWLIDYLVDKKAINIHMGVSPYYRGGSCNFWALYDEHPELVGATIHYLSKGLDSGDMLYHALPKAQETDPFVLGMLAVNVAISSLVERINSKEIFSYENVKQDKSKEIRYTKNIDFNDVVAEEYLNRLLSPVDVKKKLQERDMSMFVKPFVG